MSDSIEVGRKDSDGKLVGVVVTVPRGWVLMNVGKVAVFLLPLEAENLAQKLEDILKE